MLITLSVIPRQLRRHLTLVLGSLVLVLLVLAAFSHSLTHGFAVIDDLDQIRDNPLVQAPLEASALDLLLTPRHGYIVPVTQAAQAAIAYVGDNDPRWFHAASITLHALLLVVAYWVAVRGARHPLLGLPVMAALAVHPITSEPVCWATGLKDLLAAAFALSATLLFSSTLEQPRVGRSVTARLALSVTLALLGMLSKPTITLIAVAWLLYLWARTVTGSTAVRPAMVAATATLAFGLLIGTLSRITHDAIWQNNVQLGAFSPFQSLGFATAHVAVPLSLHPIYAVDQLSPLRDWHTYLGMLVFVAWVLLLWFLRKKPSALLFCTLSAVTFFPVSGVLPFPRQVADSYVYLPLLCLTILAGRTLSREDSRAKWLFAAVIAGLVPWLLVRTRGQTERWAGGEAMWAPLVADNPSAEAFGAYAVAEAVDGDSLRAATLFEQAYRLGYIPNYLDEFGVVLAQAGRYDDAECVLIEAAFQGTAPELSLHNYALVLSKRSSEPRYANEARFLVPLALHQAGSPKFSLTAADRVGLLRWMPNPVPSLATLPSWPRFTCPLVAQSRHP